MKFYRYGQSFILFILKNAITSQNKNSYFELICPVTKIIVNDEALNILMTSSCLIFRAYAGL
jgi:hypothetical protein